MDLSNCKLIESCNKPEAIKKSSDTLFGSPLDSKKSTLKLPRVKYSHRSNSPVKSPERSKDSLPFFAKAVKLDVSCKKYKIFRISPKDIIEKTKTHELDHKFIATKAGENLFSNYFRPKSLTPANTKLFQAAVKSHKKSMLKDAKNLKKDYFGLGLLL
jgi:hypothetical protein